MVLATGGTEAERHVGRSVPGEVGGWDGAEGASATATTRIVDRAIRRAREGDHGALRFLYVRYADEVYGYARTIVDDHDGALAITKRVFAELTCSIADYDERDVPFGVWIRAAARDVVIAAARR